MPVTFGDIGGDNLKALPVDQDPPSPEEVHLMELYFKDKKTKIEQLFSYSKDLIVLGLIFVCLSLPQTDALIIRICPSATSYPTMVVIKAILLVFLFGIIQNIYLAKYLDKNV